jgi:hypothetical protein
MRDVKGDRSRAPAPAVAPEESEESPELPPIRRQRVEVPSLQLADAVEMMQSGNDKLLVFTNVANGALGILYRRQDGHFVLVEPDLS